MNNKIVGKHIRSIRAELGLNQTDFAKLLKCNQSNVSKIEQGILLPTLPMYATLYKKAKLIMQKDGNTSVLRLVRDIIGLKN